MNEGKNSISYIDCSPHIAFVFVILISKFCGKTDKMCVLCGQILQTWKYSVGPPTPFKAFQFTGQIRITR